MPACATPTYMVFVALPLVLEEESKTTNVMPVLSPGPVSFAGAGKESTWCQVTPESVLFQRPARREPKKRMEPRLGATARRSPTPRPLSLPPILKGMGVFSRVLPLSLERKIAEGPPQSAVYMPAAM